MHVKLIILSKMQKFHKIPGFHVTVQLDTICGKKTVLIELFKFHGLL